MYNLNIKLISGRCVNPLFAGSNFCLFYKPNSYSISAGSGVNWRIAKKRV